MKTGIVAIDIMIRIFFISTGSHHVNNDTQNDENVSCWSARTW